MWTALCGHWDRSAPPLPQGLLPGPLPHGQECGQGWPGVDPPGHSHHKLKQGLQDDRLWIKCVIHHRIRKSETRTRQEEMYPGFGGLWIGNRACQLSFVNKIFRTEYRYGCKKSYQILGSKVTSLYRAWLLWPVTPVSIWLWFLTSLGLGLGIRVLDPYLSSFWDLVEVLVFKTFNKVIYEACF